MLGLPRTYWYLWSGVLINRVGSFVVPFLALYLTGERGLPVAAAGLVVSLYGLGAVPAGPLGGIVADLAGRRLTMVVGAVLSAGAMLLLAAAREPLAIAACTLVLGVTAESYRPALFASVTDLVEPGARTRAFGYLYWAANLGFAAASVLAGALAERGFRWLFLGDAATTLAMAVLIYLRVPETHPAGSARHLQPRPRLSLPYRDARFLRFLVGQLLVVLVMLQFSASLPLVLRRHGIGAARYGQLIAINGVMIVALQPLSVRLGARFPRSQVMALGTLLTGVGFALTGIGEGVWWYAMTIAVWTLGEIVFTPVSPAIIGDLAPTELRGSYQGAANLSWSVGAAVAPSLGMAALSRAGEGGLWVGCLLLALASAAMHLTSGGYRARARVEIPAGTGDA